MVIARIVIAEWFLFAVGTTDAMPVIQDPPAAFLNKPQWITGSRLLKLGESIEFRFYLPNGTDANDILIYPRYLETSDGSKYAADGDRPWLSDQKPETRKLTFAGGKASVAYKPERAGNYLAQWKAGGETFYRYFSVVEDDSIVVRFSLHWDMDPKPSMHATGIPVDYRLPVAEFDANKDLYRKYLGYHRQYGETIMPHLPDTPDAKPEDRLKLYREAMEKARSLLPDPSNARSARLELHSEIEPGYTRALAEIGVNDHCGMFEANAKPWLGMPEFPYYASPVDCRKVRQEAGGRVIAHQWDFCGGWHFVGPPSWHYKVAEGRFEETRRCLDLAMQEARNLAGMSGHPAFLLPLYDAVLPDMGYPDNLFREGLGGEAMRKFMEEYQRCVAFDLTKKYKLVFARSLDIADYYLRHFPVTPRTVFVSRTDHVEYDMWWLCYWSSNHVLIPREKIPWMTRTSSVMNIPPRNGGLKDPLSCEYILVEDQRRSIRFEREAACPIWWFDYTKQEADAKGSTITHTVTPDVDVQRSGWIDTKDGRTMELTMRTKATFADYAIALWNLPAQGTLDKSRIETNAKEFILARNTAGEYHLVLVFDLKPDLAIKVTLR